MSVQNKVENNVDNHIIWLLLELIANGNLDLIGFFFRLNYYLKCFIIFKR